MRRYANLRANRVLLIAATVVLLHGCSRSSENETGMADSTASRDTPITAAETDTSAADRVYYHAEALIRQTQRDSALVYLDRAQRMYEKEGNEEQYVRCFNRKGAVYYGKGEYKQSIVLLDSALATGLVRLKPPHPEVATSYYIKSIVLRNQGDYSQSLELNEQALQIRLKSLGKFHPRVASCYNNRGNTLADMGDNAAAMKAYEAALSIAIEAFGDDHPEVAAYFSNIGVIYGDMGDVAQALTFHKKALAIRRGAFGENHTETLISHINLGSAHQVLGDDENALSAYVQALSVLIALAGENHPYAANIYLNIGGIHDARGSYPKALAFYDKSLNILYNTVGKDHPDVAGVYENMAAVYTDQKHYDKALRYYQKTLSIRHQAFGNHHPLLAKTYNNIAQVKILQKRFREALDAFQKALFSNAPGYINRDLLSNPPLDEVLSGNQLLDSVNGKARTYAAWYQQSDQREASDRVSALQMYEYSGRLVEQLRSGYRAEGSKLFLAEKSTGFYEQAIRISLSLYTETGNTAYIETAFAFSEKSKAGILLDAIAESRARQFVGLPDSLLAQERQLRIDLAFYEKSLTEERLKRAAADSVKMAKWQDRVFMLRSRYDALLDRFETDYPDYFNLKYQTKTATAVDLRHRMFDDSHTLVEYFLGEDTLYIFTVGTQHISSAIVTLPPSFRQDVRDFRLAILIQNNPVLLQLGERLYQTLLQPVADEISGDRVTIIPDGIINYVPFEALLSMPAKHANPARPDVPYLVNKWAISYAYSATLLLETLSRAHRPAKRDYLAYAPVFEGGIGAGTRGAAFMDSAVTAGARSGMGYAYLPASRSEVLNIQKLFLEKAGLFKRLFSSPASVYLDQQASEAVLKTRELQNYRYVHFATHGFINEANPALSGLVMAQDSTTAEDGILYLDEIYNLRSNAELVVLSACETGLGKIAGGEGLMGLARGFLYAGAQNLLVSLWQINDVSTARLMKAFYADLLDGQRKSDALRNAKLSLLQSGGETAHPYYWAPFILIGK